MEKLMFIVLLFLFLFVGCEKRYERTSWVNSEVECGGVKDPLNNLEWLREASRFDDYIDNSSSDYNYIFLFRNKETQKDHIVIDYYSSVSCVRIYDCEGVRIDGGHYSLQNQPKYAKTKIANGPPAPCDTCDEFFRTHVLVDTIAYSVVD